MKNSIILKRIANILLSLILIMFLFIYIMNFNEIKDDAFLLYLETSEIFFIISLLIFFIDKKKLIVIGFYILVFSLCGIVIEIVMDFKIADTISLICGIYILYLYIKKIINLEHKPIICILSFVFPKEWSYKYKLASIKLREKDVNKSIKYANKSLELGASKYLYNRLYGQILLENKNYKESINILKNAYEENNEDIELLNFIGYGCEIIGNKEGAIKYYSKYLNKKGNIDILYKRACLFTDIEKYRKAIDDYTKCLEIDKERADILYNRGLLFEKINLNAKSIEDWKKSIKMKNPDPKAFIVLGNLEREKGNIEEAKKLYFKGIKRNPELKGYIPKDLIESDR